MCLCARVHVCTLVQVYAYVGEAGQDIFNSQKMINTEKEKKKNPKSGKRKSPQESDLALLNLGPWASRRIMKSLRLYTTFCMCMYTFFFLEERFMGFMHIQSRVGSEQVF